MTQSIKIMDVNTENDLVLYPNDTVLVEHGTKVIWSIETKKVYSFRIKKKKGSQGIFSRIDPPPVKHTTQGGGTVHKKSNVFTYYNYSIFWKAEKGGREIEFDPIIAVKPQPATDDPDSMSKLIVGAAVGLVAILAIQFLLKRREGNGWKRDAFKQDL